MSTSLLEQPCFVYIARPLDVDLQPNEMQIRDALENGSTQAKREALKKLIHSVLSGERVSSTVLMYVIRFCLPSQDHGMKRLLLIFWEIVPKRNADGKLLQEMILVCDAYRKDLQHPNEFVRGSTLRFLCRLKEPELLEPLMPAIRSCLEYRHAYVRRNAVLAAFTIYKNFDFLIPDAPDLVYNFLESEQDASCKRNAFMMLLHADRRLALDYLSTCLEHVITFSNILQLIVVQLVYTVCLRDSGETRRFLKCIYKLMQSTSSAVRYEAACVLIALTATPAAIKAALNTLVQLISTESDNGVKLIVLDRLVELRTAPGVTKALQDMVMDLLRVLHCPDLEVQKRTLALAYELVTVRNVEDVVTALRKEVARPSAVASASKEDNLKYRQLLVKTVHNICIKFPDVSQSLVPSLVELLSDGEEAAVAEVLVFVREVMIAMPSLRHTVIGQLLQLLPSIQNANALRGALWILGEHCEAAKEMEQLLVVVKNALGTLPIDNSTDQPTEALESKSTEKRLLNPDGTYATHSALTTTSSSSLDSGAAKRLVLRKALLDGDFFFVVSLASILTKVAVRYAGCQSAADEQQLTAVNRFNSEVMFILASILQAGRRGGGSSSSVKSKMPDGAAEQLKSCLKFLNSKCEEQFGGAVLEKCRDSLAYMLRLTNEAKSCDDKLLPLKQTVVLPYEKLNIGVLESEADLGAKENVFDQSLNQALGLEQKRYDPDEPLSTRLDNITQLSGYADPIYAEAFVELNSYDIKLDCLLVNQTNDTLEAVTLELATLGDLKLVEKPMPITLAPNDFATVKTSIKVSSTENGVVFGTLSYDVRGSTGDCNCIYLNDIHIDIINYIVPAVCTDEEFRQMWSEFEWENKVAVMTAISDLKQYLFYLVKQTNMRCLTPDEVLSGDSGFLAANLYARSIFGEDALANLSIEKADDDPRTPVVGHIRIRAKSQGMALSMGDRIGKVQKAHYAAAQNIDLTTAAAIDDQDKK